MRAITSFRTSGCFYQVAGKFPRVGDFSLLEPVCDLVLTIGAVKCIEGSRRRRIIELAVKMSKACALLLSQVLLLEAHVRRS